MDRRRPQPAFSICTLVNHPRHYRDMVAAFRSKGFDGDDVEFLCIDTTRHAGVDAYGGLNLLLREAAGRYVILCHQDVRPTETNSVLCELLEELDALDPAWGLAGNAGRTPQGKMRLGITDPSHYRAKEGPLPAKVVSLDEDFIVKNGRANLGLSNDLQGFHLYGTDLVTLASLAGWNAYAIDYHLVHFGKGRTGAAFANCLEGFERKYERALRPRPLRTTVARTHLGRLSLASRAVVALDAFWAEDFADVRSGIKYFLRDKVLRRPYRIDGMTFRLPDSASVAARKEITKGRYELPERTLVRRHLPPSLPVVELGGAYGIVSRVIGTRLAAGVSHVVVEANPALIDLCRENAKAGPAHRPEIVTAAISYSGAPTVSFNVTPGTHDSRLAGAGEDGTVTVPAVTLSQLLSDHGLNVNYSLVVDIEGAEFDLFEHEAAALRDCAVAIVEVHPCVFAENGRSEEDFLALVEARGFDVIERCGAVYALRNRRTNDKDQET
jgi:FkbM family methyltransferase